MEENGERGEKKEKREEREKFFSECEKTYIVQLKMGKFWYLIIN